MGKWDVLRLDEFLAENPKFRIAELSDERVVLLGEYDLKAQLAGCQVIDKTYRLRFVCTNNYPRILPKVFDVGAYFPRSQDFHTYNDGEFCLGSELKIKGTIQKDQTITNFFSGVVDPFLYSVSHQIEFGVYPLGELSHGEPGLIEDYENIFGIKGKASVLLVLRALGKRKREANKLPCPCGCGLRLGRCIFRITLLPWRSIERRRWFRDHLKNSFTAIERTKRVKRKKVLLDRWNVQLRSLDAVISETFNNKIADTLFLTLKGGCHLIRSP
jgi:hypothetical protein